MSGLVRPGESPFDAIRSFDGDREYWSARDLQPVLGYEKWQKFEDAIDRASTACSNSGNNPSDHFTSAGKMVSVGSGATRQVQDWHLSRYGAYLVAMNGDPRKPEIAAAQSYFAIQTRRSELQSIEDRTPARTQSEIVPAELPQLLRAMADVIESNRVLSSRLQNLEERATFQDTLLESHWTGGLNTAAKAIGWGEQRFREWLVTHNYLMRNGLPYQEWINRGIFIVAIEEGHPVTQVTPRGLAVLRRAARQEDLIEENRQLEKRELPGSKINVVRHPDEVMAAFCSDVYTAMGSQEFAAGTLGEFLRSWPAFADLLGPKLTQDNFHSRIGRLLKLHADHWYGIYRIRFCVRAHNSNLWRIEKDAMALDIDRRLRDGTLGK